MNKRGMLLATETLKMVVALISLTFLIYLLASIYYASVVDNNKEQAVQTVRRISEVENRLRTSAVSSEEVNDLTPAGWMVFSFGDLDNKPDFCANENCLCICDELSSFSKLLGTQQEECTENGACKIIPELLNFVNFEITKPTNPTSIRISRTQNGMKVEKI